MPITQLELDEIALTRAEYDQICRHLDREPTKVELGMFGALWSEHCGYKHSRELLKLFPSTGRNILLEAGRENAGAVDIGDGKAVVFKVESHNHPSAVEPFEGAATGVGGIVRDILALGARPIALLNSLRFGPLDNPSNRFLLNGVVGGISWYGNCIGVPDVGGEVYFDECYTKNPLVNALCVGIVEKRNLTSASTRNSGNLLFLAGSETGRDGIHGASGLASRTFDETREMRPTVQVGNPYLEKLLIEACLEANSLGLLEGLQDLGAAGLTSASVESADKGGTGIELDVSLVPRREIGMTPYEIMLSESQERMLLIVKPENTPAIVNLFKKWDVQCVPIGTTTSSMTASIWDGNQEVARVPINLLTSAPKYRLQGKPNEEDIARSTTDMSNLPMPKLNANAILIKLIGSPNIASKENIYKQYDNQVQTNTVILPGADAAVLRIKGTNKAIAVCIDGNSRYCFLNPYVGGAIAVAEACRNLACVGADPIALTDCLNFGNPEDLSVYYQLESCISGMAEACEVFGVPVISGNVSLYNETDGKSIFPTPVVGALGLIEPLISPIGNGFPEPGLEVLVLGSESIRGSGQDMAGSEYLAVLEDLIVGQPIIDLDYELKVQSLCRRVVNEGIATTAHDCSEGGLAVAIAESCIIGNMGFEGVVDISDRWEWDLFGEKQSRILISVSTNRLAELESMAKSCDVKIAHIGKTTTSKRMVIGSLIDLQIDNLRKAWQQSIV